MACCAPPTRCGFELTASLSHNSHPPRSLFVSQTFSTASLTTNPAAAMRGEGTELQPTSSFFGNLKMTFSSASLTSNPMETLQEVEMEEADVRAFDAQTDLGLGVEAAHAAPTKSGSIVYDAGI